MPLAKEDNHRVSDQTVSVLLIEDSVLIRDSLVDLIESDPHRTVSMTTDSEAIAKEALAHEKYDVAIIDLELREGSGQGILRFMQNRPDAPLRIVLTSRSELRVQQECLALGADYFFDKTSQFGDVSSAIDRYMAHSSHKN